MKRPEIGLLLSKHLDRETTAAEAQIVEERLHTDPAFALQMKQMKALGCVMDIAVKGLKPDASLLANIMGRVTAEAAHHRKPAVTVPTPSRILEMPRTERRGAPVWRRVAAVAAIMLAIIGGVLLLTIPGPPPPAQKSISIAARETQGDVKIISAQSGQSSALVASATLLVGDRIVVGDAGKADLATDDWNYRLNNNTAITYVDTADKSIILEMKEGEVWAGNTVAAPAHRLQINTAFGTITTSAAYFDVKIENIVVPVETAGITHADDYARVTWHSGGGVAFVFDKCFALCGEAPAPQNEEAQPPQPPEPQQPPPSPQMPQAAPEMRSVTRITIAVAGGIVSYASGGKQYTLSANGVLQEDTTGRHYAAQLTAHDVDLLLGWWDKGTVNTPDIERMSLANQRPPEAPPPPAKESDAENQATPPADNNGKDSGDEQATPPTPGKNEPAPPEEQKGKPAPAKGASQGG